MQQVTSLSRRDCVRGTECERVMFGRLGENMRKKKFLTGVLICMCIVSLAGIWIGIVWKGDAEAVSRRGAAVERDFSANQSIGEAVTKLLEDRGGEMCDKFLEQGIQSSYNEDDEVDEDDCIWEGDEDEDEDDSMSVVDDEIFDEDDYDRMEEE